MGIACARSWTTAAFMPCSGESYRLIVAKGVPFC
jgi:hypothetical protein